MKTWKIKHNEIIKNSLNEINKQTDRFILKGGTALKQCYDLDRFSEDIDLDATSGNLKNILTRYCTKNHYGLLVKKNTDLVKRYMIDYGNKEKKLKIEVSYRRENISKTEYTMINGIKVYTIDRLANMKTMAYMGRDRLRDLYDLSFIADKYFDKLSDTTKNMMQDAVQAKGIEQCEYLLKTQKDDLINPDVLIDKFLKMYEKLELRTDRTIDLNKKKDNIHGMSR